MDGRASGLQRVCVGVGVHAHVRALGSTRDREQGEKVAGGQMSCWKPLEGGGDPGLGSEGGVGWILRTAGTSLVATA